MSLRALPTAVCGVAGAAAPAPSTPAAAAPARAETPGKAFVPRTPLRSRAPVRMPNGDTLPMHIDVDKTLHIDAYVNGTEMLDELNERRGSTIHAPSSSLGKDRTKWVETYVRNLQVYLPSAKQVDNEGYQWHWFPYVLGLSQLSEYKNLDAQSCLATFSDVLHANTMLRPDMLRVKNEADIMKAKKNGAVPKIVLALYKVPVVPTQPGTAVLICGSFLASMTKDAVTAVYADDGDMFHLLSAYRQILMHEVVFARLFVPIANLGADRRWIGAHPYKNADGTVHDEAALRMDRVYAMMMADDPGNTYDHVQQYDYTNGYVDITTGAKGKEPKHSLVFIPYLEHYLEAYAACGEAVGGDETCMTMNPLFHRFIMNVTDKKRNSLDYGHDVGRYHFDPPGGDTMAGFDGHCYKMLKAEEKKKRRKKGAAAPPVGMSTPVAGPAAAEPALPQRTLPAYMRGETEYVDEAEKTAHDNMFVDDDDDPDTERIMNAMSNIAACQTHFYEAERQATKAKETHGATSRQYADSIAELSRIVVILNETVNTSLTPAEAAGWHRVQDHGHFPFTPRLGERGDAAAAPP